MNTTFGGGHTGREFAFEEIPDEHTKGVLQEVAYTQTIVPKNLVNDIICSGDWGSFWRCAREETSSTKSRLNFSHYKAGANSRLITHFHATGASVVLKSGLGLERWSRGMSVMLEKFPGCHLISKHQFILLMEADFNCTNKLIFGNCMLCHVRKYDLMPDETFSEQNLTAEEGSLAKTLFYDVVCQCQMSAGISLGNADNCYDQISYAIATLVFCLFGVSKEVTGAMLKTIQEMKFFLWMAYRDSKGCAGSLVDIKTQGLCQGNGAALARWAVVSITILRAHNQRGHGAKFFCPISLINCNLAAALYVDDTDVVHFNMTQTKTRQRLLHACRKALPIEDAS